MYDSTDLLLHRVRFYVSQLYSINCIAYNEKHNKVALLRRRIRKYQPSQNDMHSVIEIWNLQNKASFLEQIIHDDSDNLTLLEDVVWSKNGRLFACGLNTYLNEYDLENSKIKQSYCVNSSPAWCASIDPLDKLIAVGTEDGYVCIYNIYNSCLQYEKILDKNENRILCLQWYSTQGSSCPLLIGGSIDYIKIWNYQSGRCTSFIKVGNTGVVVWCLKVLSDFTIVSGDSSGSTSFWNGKMTTLNSSYKCHKGDVLSICTSNDEQTIYSAGVDPTIMQFNRNANKNDQWVMSLSRRPHSHDVRSLACTKNNWLLSGGIDSVFCQTFYPPSLQISHLSNFDSKIATVSNSNSNYLCLQYENFVQIWKLGNAESDVSDLHCDTANSVNVKPLKIVDNAVKLLEINSRKAITSFAFDAEWLIYANYSNLKVFSWSEDKIEKVKLLHDPIANIDNICMIGDNRFVVTYGKNYESFKLDKFGVVSEYCHSFKYRVHKILVHDSKLIVSLTDSENTISIIDLSTNDVLASFANPLLPLVMKVNTSEGNNRLWIAYANALLVQYDLGTLSLSNSYYLSKYKSNENKECKCFNEHWPIKQIAFGKNIILFSDDNNLYALNLRKDRITKCEKYRHIAFMDNTSSTELVLVEVTPEMLFNMLPPTTKTKSFGT